MCKTYAMKWQKEKTMRDELSWKVMGRIFSLLLGLFTIIRNTYKKTSVNMGIISWIVEGKGRKIFVEEFLIPLGERYAHPFIDCAVRPKMAEGGWNDDEWEIVEHISHESFRWDEELVKLFISKEQGSTYLSRVTGEDVLKEIKEVYIPLNATILDFLLSNQHLIPYEWRFHRIYFPGTVYMVKTRDDLGMYARSLVYTGTSWTSDPFILKHIMDDEYKAAVFEK